MNDNSNNDHPDHVDVLVVGAGPAGLTAAYHLSKNSKLRVHVIEADPRYVGGISRTESYKGFLFDIGGHRFFSKSREIEALWREILPDDFLDRPRKSRILYRGRFYSYPLRGLEALRNLGVTESVLCVLSYLKARAFPRRMVRSFHDWVANQFGERLFGIFFKTYTEKVWGMSCDELSADWAAQRIKGLDLGAAIRNALGVHLPKGARPAAGQSVIKTLIDSFRYPRKGPGMLWEEAARKIRARGVSLTQGAAATRFEWDVTQERWQVQVGHGGAVISARHVISSAPLREVVATTFPRPACAGLAQKLGYRDFLTVALILDRTDLDFDDNWIYIHEPGVRVGRIQNYRSWSEEMVPDKDRVCLGLEYFCFEGDGLWSSSDEDLVQLAARELQALGIARSGAVLDGRVVRQPKAYPVYDDDYRAVVQAIRSEYETRFATMHFVGRNGMHKYNNQDHAMMTGLLAAENIIAGTRRYDLWAVNEDAQYIEEGAAGREAALSGLRWVPARVQS
jgi:protoporphyrinogen oxidase